MGDTTGTSSVFRAQVALWRRSSGTFDAGPGSFNHERGIGGRWHLCRIIDYETVTSLGLGQHQRSVSGLDDQWHRFLNEVDLNF